MKYIRIGKLNHYQLKYYHPRWAIVDDDMYEFLMQFQWAYGTYTTTRIAGRNVKMEHLIMGKPIKPLIVDHKNRNPLDNRRENLRIVSLSENSKNANHYPYCRSRDCPIIDPYHKTDRHKQLTQN